jgi:hypothetical protein
MLRPKSVVHAGILAAALAVVNGCSPRAPQVDGLPEVVDFNFHVRPILSDRCFKCHGPDDRARKAGLRLDTEAGALAALESGRRAVVPRSTRRSALVHRILSTDPTVMMPTPESHLTLNDYERAVLVRWIEQGAAWKPHWAFIPPVKAAPPATGDTRTGASEIDAFVVARLRQEGLAPAPEASRERLLRRVTFDLTGLPPTLEELDAFLRDEAPGAYERAVDRLLASPAYGEHMAAEWMDVARFADSHGYQDDGMRDMSPWRDWVIRAFNRNLAFDDFITWQLAGDLLPQPSHEQVLATAFNRHHMQSQEGGIVPEEYRVEYVADRVDTFGRAFLGLTMDCARCHDHKYDPVLQREYFELFGFFNSINESGQIPYSGMPSPTLAIGNEEADEALARLRPRIRALETETAIDNPALDAAFSAWVARAAASRAARRAMPGDALSHLPLEGSEQRMVPETLSDEERRKRRPKLVPRRFFADAVRGRAPATLGGDRDRVPETVPGPTGQAQRLPGDSFIDLGRETGQFERNQPFSFALWLRIEETGTSGPLVTRSAGVFSGNRGFEVMLRADGRLTAALHHTFPDSSIEIATDAPVAAGEWRHLVFAYDGSSRAAGIRLFLDGQPAPTRIVVDNLQRSILTSGNPKQPNWTEMPGVRIGKRHDETLSGVSVDEFQLFGRQLTAIEAAALHGAADPIDEILQTAEGARTEAERHALREHYVLRVDRSLDAARRELQALRGEENAVLTALPVVMVMRELPRPRPTFVLDRGAYDSPTVPVEPGTPRAIRPFPDTLPKNRLGLATWLLDPQHPLTSRVIVNRYWALFFGRGIVSTPEDFGSQGELPTHPALLDWLAVTFVESGWDVKALHERIVTSATYRQASAATPDLRERDPENRLLARGPAYRFSAEQIRDHALAVSGLLVPTIGGRSVYPYQPAGLWEELATRNETTYVQGKGDDLYRRSLYTIWKRSTPPPSAISFDAAERLSCTVRRQRTSTPLQALVLMNDPQYVEAARLLAERMARDGGGDPAERVAVGFRLVTSRGPSDEEARVLTELYAAERERFDADVEAARRLLDVGERPRDPTLDAADVAALTVVANTLLSLDEAVTKR